MRCSVFIATSVDGFVAGPNDELDWLASVERPDEDYGYKAFIDTVDVLVMGRRSYEVVLGFPEWRYEGTRVIVLSKSLQPGNMRHGAELFAGSPTELVAGLRAQGSRRAYVDGAAVIRSFLEAELVDDLTISVIPVILGRGIRLFGDALPRRDLVLEENLAFPSGLVQSRYRVV
ncbi:MAG: dihydrofolate reductase [Labilithrix sp.]|nr:dihydrofolate reductase [Labilithrix sp.]